MPRHVTTHVNKGSAPSIPEKISNDDFLEPLGPRGLGVGKRRGQHLPKIGVGPNHGRQLFEKFRTITECGRFGGR